MAVAYSARAEDREPQLAPLPTTYVDYVRRQREQLRTGVLDPQRAYWSQQLDGVPSIPDLGGEKAGAGAPPSVAVVALAGRERMALIQAAHDCATTPFTVLLAALWAVLAGRTGAHDFAIGAPVAGRERLEDENVVGLYLNSVALRLRPPPDAAARTLIAHANEVVLDALDHASLPFEEVVRDLQPTREPGRTPVFDILCNLLPEMDDRRALGPAALRVLPAVHTHAKAWLTIYATLGEELRIECVGDGTQLSPNDVREIARVYQERLVRWSADLDSPAVLSAVAGA